MFIPTEDLIIGKGPRAGMFYRRASTSGTTVAQIANVAAFHLRQEGYDVSTFQMVQLIANSTWNHSHIRYARTGYENYGFDGPQMQKKYAHDPISSYGSGTGWPTFWIPTADGREPEDLYGVVAPPPQVERMPGIPGGDPARLGPAPGRQGGDPSRMVSPIRSTSPYPGGAGSPDYGGGGGHQVPGGLVRAPAGSFATAGFSPWLLLLAVGGAVVIWQATKKKPRKQRK
jgi:hypothetical protein